MKSVWEKATLIRLVIFDVDGVLTDGSLYLDNRGEEYKAFYAPDGLGMTMLQTTGVAIAIITARCSEVVTHRMQSLGIKYIYQGQANKILAFNQLCQQLQLQPQQIAYVGDDMNDIAVMSQVGLAVAVANAHALVVKQAHWQTRAYGGRGAAREVCELIMQAQGTWITQLAQYGITHYE
jgi:3-deoxy-D-manno-octulosonate 8-phosphate phosphatase (KDO 8-P phosphatase)